MTKQSKDYFMSERNIFQEKPMLATDKLMPMDQ